MPGIHAMLDSRSDILKQVKELALEIKDRVNV